ncbi:CAP domain-containing protein [Gracilibacillus sp. YIM 98692]|uniref:CAP domain-containing protein n=1 Tax=Gracilibacillus sp. YIM 98692 TaxID=2663532 RepID=UPI0013D60DCE|nr:CAP domain-containing protein [Gracilibacillus sp. YIM 98692]
MFKKKLMVTTLAATLLIGGGFSTSVDASAQEGTQHNGSQFSYSIKGDWDVISNYNIEDILKKYFNSGEIEQAPENQNTEQPEPSQEEVEQDDSTQVEKEPSESNNDQLSQFEQQVVDLTNEERAKHGLAELQADTELSKVAREKSNDMATNGYFSHQSPTYGSPFDMLKQYGISYRTAGENIAKGQRSPEEVVNAWMNSQGHRANILNENFTHIGVGHVAEGNHWTQLFIGK